LASVVLLSTTLSCGPTEQPMQDASEDRAQELARRVLIVDTHIDVPYRLKEKMQDVAVAAPEGDFDYPRARAGGLDVAFMSIYVPASNQETGDAREVADELIDMVEGLVRKDPDKFGLVTGVAQARARLDDGVVGLALGIENGASVQGSLENLRHFFDRGVRYITLAHSKANHICDSSYDEERRWNGLSPFGREVVAEMNRLGMMIDVSHVSDEAFGHVMEVTRAPVIASHSSCRHFTPEWERNMSDEMIRDLAQGGGVIQINFGSSFVDNDYRVARAAAREAIREHLDANGIADDSDHAHEYADEYFAANPIPRALVADVVDHIDHVVALVGVDHVGLGSDYDGLGDTLPEGLEDVSSYPNLIRELLGRGYSEEDVQKICSGNLLRVWTAVERVAAELKTTE
jgi:membrane dipeptidase